MSAPRLLIITPLDVHALPGNLEQNRAAEYRRRGYEVTTLYKRMNRSKRFLDLVRDTVTMRTRVEHSAELGTLVSVDPLFNYFAGLRTNAEAGGESNRRSGGLRRLAIRLLWPLAVVRDALFLPCFRWATWRRLRGDFDLCLGFGPWGGAVATGLKRRGRVRFFLYEDRDFEAGLVPDGLRKSYTRALERRGIRKADAAVSIGHRLADLRAAETGRRPEVLPSGVDFDKYESARSKVRTEPRLVYVGNLLPWSGLESTLRALAEAVPTACLDIIGDGLPAHVERLRRLIDELDLSDRVSLMGPRPHDELADHLGKASIGLANSSLDDFRRYATPLKVIEYMAACVVVLCTRETEAGDRVEAAGAGIAVPHDAASIAEGLTTLLSDPARLESMRSSGIRAAEALDWRRIVDAEIALAEKGS